MGIYDAAQLNDAEFQINGLDYTKLFIDIDMTLPKKQQLSEWD